MSDVSGAPASDVALSVTVTGDKDRFLLAGSFTSDKNGLVVIKLAPNSGQFMHINAETKDTAFPVQEQTIGTLTMTSFDSKTNGLLVIKHENDGPIEVGKVFIGKLEALGAVRNVKTPFIAVLHLGKIISMQTVAASGRFSLPIERHMVPSVRIVAITYANGQLLSDAVKLDVKESACGLELEFIPRNGQSLQGNSSVIKPGGTGEFYLKGQIGDVVSLIGVDEAVYALAKGTRLSKESLLGEMKALDDGCGPGDGQNSLDVLANAGLSGIGLEDNTGSRCAVHRTKRMAVLPIAARFKGISKKCCILGLMVDNKKRSCDKRLEIVKRHQPRDHECQVAFLACCNEADGPRVRQKVDERRFQATVYHSEPDERTRTKAEAGFVHISDEDKIELNTPIREDFRETWLFDLVVLKE